MAINIGRTQSSTNTMMAGAVAGFKIGGPIGGVVGGALGGVFGGVEANKAQRRQSREFIKASKVNTKLSLDSGQMVFGDARKSRSDVLTRFDRDQASLRARVGASGSEKTGGNYTGALGEIASTRNDAMSDIDAQIERFRQTDSYEIFKNEYDTLTKGATTSEALFADLETHGGYGGGNYAGKEKALVKEGFAGSRAYTDEQFNNIVQLGGFGEKEKGFGDDEATGRGRYQAENYEEYLTKIAPTLGQFEASQFGSDEEKAQYVKDTDVRIKEANEWWKGIESLDAMEKQFQSAMYDDEDGARYGGESTYDKELKKYQSEFAKAKQRYGVL